MTKSSIVSVWQSLLTESDSVAKNEASKYINENAARILKKLMEDDADITSEIETSGSNVVTVIYDDPEADCDYDDEIVAASNCDDASSYGWSKGKRILTFIYDNKEDADNASAQIGDLSDMIDGIEVISSDSTQTDETETSEDGDESVEDTETSETSEIDPEEDTEELVSETSDTDSDTDTDEEIETSTDETETSEDGDESVEDTETSTDETEEPTDKVADAFSELKDALIAAGISIDIDDNSDEITGLEESILDYEDVKIPQNKTVDDKSFLPSTDFKNRLKLASPIEYPKGNEENSDGTKQEKSPTVKDLPSTKNTIKGNVEKGYKSVSKEGDKSATINSNAGFGTEETKSVID